MGFLGWPPPTWSRRRIAGKSGSRASTAAGACT